jgi:hypothetical protein
MRDNRAHHRASGARGPLATNRTTPFAPEVVGETSRGLDPEAKEGQNPRLASRMDAQEESPSVTQDRCGSGAVDLLHGQVWS